MKPVFQSTKVIELGSCAFRQWRASHSHCRFLHGYQLKAKLWFGSSSLDEKNWCVDFGSLKDLKAELKSIYDHTTTVAADDPELETFKSLHDKGIIQLYVLKDGAGIERAAENVYHIANRHVRNLTSDRCWVDKVEVFEHEENSATYSQEDVVTQNQTFKVDTASTILDNNITLGILGAQGVITTSPITPGTGIINALPTDDTFVDNIPTQTPVHERGARIGSGPVSNGMSNPFAGTSWGA